MSDNFVILFLSDAHIGYPGRDLDIQSVFKPLFDDIQGFQKKGIVPSLIIFSGDLCYGEREESPLNHQCELGNNWLISIYHAINLPFGSVPLLIVPGNHDMDRVNRDKAHDKWIDSIDSKDQLYQDMNNNTPVWKNLLTRQQAWAEFVQKLNLENSIFDPNLNMSIMKIDHDGKKIGIAGFNSSWASYKDKHDSHLWIGKYQYDQAMSSLSDCDFKIAVSHHPTSCLDDLERNWFSEKLEATFRIHFHGHVHDQWFTDSHRHLKVAAGSCYQGAEKENAYSWLIMNFKNEVCDIHLRKYEEKGEGGWVPFCIPGKTDTEGVGHVQHLFASSGFGKEPNNDHHKTEVEKTLVSKPSQAVFSDLTSIEEYIHTLQDLFSFRWEPVSFTQSDSPVTVYWPIRLRQPTPIHAVQCFAAAGLQKLGAKIVLFLDDFGNIEVSKDDFCSTVEKWFNKVGVPYSKVQVRLCSETISDSDDVWNLLQCWFANALVDMQEVLQVSKLIKGEEVSKVSFHELATRKPRRLMTPAIVWACLISLYKENDGDRFLTLGGYDESRLWMAWRRRINHKPAVSFGHLYIPEVYSPETRSSETLSMGGTLKFDWDAEDDIRFVFNKEIVINKDDEWLSPNRIIPWCFSGCYLLPSFVAGTHSTLTVNGMSISKVDQLINVKEMDQLKNSLSRSVAHWVL